MFKACIGLNCARQIDWIDRRNCQLTAVPDDIFRHEASLEELLLDTNMIQELPPKMFRLTNLRKLSLSENDLSRIPHGIANLTKLYELDVSKNGIEEVPGNIQFCRSLSVLDLSCNPLLRIPDFISNVHSLTHLYLNDTALPALPRGIGNLKSLVVLEARENILRKLPMTIGELVSLERLDLGNNEIEELPPTVGRLEELTELWLDSNSLSTLPETFCQLVNLTVLDITKNKLERFPPRFSQLGSLCDLHASENCIEALPEDFGCLKSLIQIKLDLNHLVNLPDSIGDLPKATEIFLFDNMLESVPPTLFNIPTLQMLNLDRNHLMEIPPTVSNCKSLHVLSLRENDLVCLPEDIGSLENLRVLDVVGNRLPYLPMSVSNLSLDALWVRGSQPQPLISLQPHSDPDNSERKVLMCQYLPQRGPYGSECDIPDMTSENDFSEDSWCRERSNTLPAQSTAKMSVAFEPNTAGLPADDTSKLVRFPTPFRKDLKNKRKKPKLNARPTNTVFKKGSLDDLTVHAVTELLDVAVDSEAAFAKPTSDVVADAPSGQNEGSGAASNGLQAKGAGGEWEARESSPLLKSTGVRNLSEGFLPQDQTAMEPAELVRETPPILTHSRLQTVEVTVELQKEPGRSLGFSIAGGRGSTPAYEDVDESIFITKITSRGVADMDGSLRLGDKVLSVNGQSMLDATHSQAVAALKSSREVCTLTVSREVLVVLPAGVVPDDESGSYPQENFDKCSTPTTENGAIPVLEPATQQQPSPPPLGSSDEISGSGNDVERRRASGGGEEEGRSSGANIEWWPSHSSLHSSRTDSQDDQHHSEHNILEEGLDDSATSEQPQKGKGGLVLPYVNMEIAQTILDEPTPTEEEGQEKEDSHKEIVAGGIAEESKFEEEVVILDRSIENLGLSIVGGIDQKCHVFGMGKPGIYISKVSPGGAAAETGKLRMGDRVISVNGHVVEDATHDEVVDWLVSQVGDIELLVRHEPQPDGLEEVVLYKGNAGKLGISIKGGAKGSLGNPLDPDDEGIFISKITKGGAAERDGRLRIGHRILEADGHSLLGANHVEAVRILRDVGESLTLVVCHGYHHSNMTTGSDVTEQKKLSGSLDAIQEALSKETKQGVPVKRTHSSFSAVVGDRHGDPGHRDLDQFQQEALTRLDSSEDRELPAEESLEAEKKTEECLASDVQLVSERAEVHEQAEVSESVPEAQPAGSPKQLNESGNNSLVLASSEGSRPVSIRSEDLPVVRESDDTEDEERGLCQGDGCGSSNGCDGDGNCSPASLVNAGRNKPRTNSPLSLKAELPERPLSAMDARRLNDLLVPHPLPAFPLNPEKLSFKERLALYQNRVDASSLESDLNRTGLRRSCSSLLSSRARSGSPLGFSKGGTGQFVAKISKQFSQSSGNLLMSTVSPVVSVTKPANKRGPPSPEVPRKPSPASPLTRSLSADRAERRESLISDPPLTDSSDSLGNDEPAHSPSLTDSDSKLDRAKQFESPIPETSNVSQSSREPDMLTCENGQKGMEAFVAES